MTTSSTAASSPLPLIGYSWDWGILFQRGNLIAMAGGLGHTVLVSILGLAFGLILGLLTAILRAYRVPVASLICHAYVDFFRTTPVLVQLIWIYYVMPVLIGINLPPLTAGVVTLSLNAGAFLCEVFRGGLESIAQGQHDAAHVLGLSHLETLRYVIVPQAVRRSLPATTNILISLVKDSSLVSTIAVADLTYEAQNLVANTYRPFEFYTFLAVIYFAMTYPISIIAVRLERRFRVT